MYFDEFRQSVEAGVVPERFPGIKIFKIDDHILQRMMSEQKVRQACVDAGMWAIVDMTWTKTLADVLMGQKVLEIMAGHGWLAKALTDHGIDITATDSKHWDGEPYVHDPDKYPLGSSVIQCGALEAVKRFEADILLCSWPHPNSTKDLLEAMDTWGTEKPVIYIGEEDGGACAPPEFFKHFEHVLLPGVEIPRWSTTEDAVWLGNWTRKP